MTQGPACIKDQDVIGYVGALAMSHKISVRQLKAARQLLGWSQEELAARSGVSFPTIKRLEAAGGMLGGYPETGAKIMAALQGAGIEFLGIDNDGPGVRMRNADRPL